MNVTYADIQIEFAALGGGTTDEWNHYLAMRINQNYAQSAARGDVDRYFKEQARVMKEK